MTRLALIFLTGCTIPQYANQHDPPRGRASGPSVAAYEAKIVGALHAAENQQMNLIERKALNKAFREHARTNDLTPPLPTDERRLAHPRAPKGR